MRKERSHTLSIVIGTCFFLLLIVFAAIKIYSIALEETKRNHQMLQKDVADAAAASITQYLNYLSTNLSFLCRLHHHQFQMNPALLDSLAISSTAFGVKNLFIFDQSLNITYISNDSLPAWAKQDIVRQKKWLLDPKNQTKNLYSPVYPNDANGEPQGLSFLILQPLVSERPKQTIGIVGEMVDFSWLVEHYICSIDLGNTGLAWIMDGAGRLLHHPKHPEMILRDAFEMSDECLTCHTSFDVQKNMLTSEAAFGQYTVADGPTKIMSYVPIRIQNERWVLVMTSNLDEVTSIIRSKFRLFFFLIAIVLTAIIVNGLLFTYVNTKRIRAEEARRHSEQKELLHQQICHAAKMASIGELVDTVAHEINTPISIIGAQADAMFLSKANTDENNEELHIIKDQTRRIRNYTRRLLTHSQMMAFKPRAANITKLIDGCVYLLGHRFRVHDINIQTRYENNLPLLELDKGQIEQVLINLLNNAVDAIGNHGNIDISVCNRGKNSKSGVEIMISDSGAGIPDDVLPHIFEPFYTTKSRSHGTGLGLSISKAIVSRHDGKLKVESSEETGTTFSVILGTNCSNGSAKW